MINITRASLLSDRDDSIQLDEGYIMHYHPVPCPVPSLPKRGARPTKHNLTWFEHIQFYTRSKTRRPAPTSIPIQAVS